MRASVDKSDPGYSQNAFAGKVFLDDVELSDCLTADEEGGMAVVYARDSRRRLIAEKGELRTKTVYGKVEIVCP